MDEYGFGLRRSLSIMGICCLIMFLSCFLILPAALPGLLSGCITGIVYYLLLHYQLKRSSTMSARESQAYLRKGSLTRFCLVAIGIVFIFRAPGAIISGFLIGTFLPFRLVIFLNGLCLLQKEMTDSHTTSTTGIVHPLLHGRHLNKMRF